VMKRLGRRGKRDMNSGGTPRAREGRNKEEGEEDLKVWTPGARSSFAARHGEQGIIEERGEISPVI